MQRYIIAFCFLLLSINSKGQPPLLYFNHLSVNNGLSQGVNNCIYKDSRGFVWISSFDGLNRFDGISCYNYRSNWQDSTGIRGTLFLNILEDSQADLWIGSNEGLNHYDRKLGRFENFKPDNYGNNEQFISPFYIDIQNNIWIQSRSDIYLFKPDSRTFKKVYHFPVPGNLLIKPYPSAPYRRLQHISVIINNSPTIWELSIVNDKTNLTTTTVSTANIKLNNMVVTGVSSYWLACSDGLRLFKEGKQISFINQYNEEPLGQMNTLAFDKKGRLWAGSSDKGLYVADTSEKKVTDHYQTSAYNSNFLSGNQILYLYPDDKDQLWVSVWGKGVDYSSLEKFRFSYHISREEAIASGSDNFIRSIIQVGSEFWCGTQLSGILILDQQKKIKQILKNGLPASIEHLFIDNNKKIWAATFSGLFIIDPQSRQVKKVTTQDAESNTAANQYNYICQLKNDKMLASSNAGLYILEPDGNNYRKRIAGAFSSKEVFLTSYQDATGSIYVSRAFKGFSVCRMREDSLIIEQELPIQASIKCFAEMPDSTIWIGSTIGLIQFSKYSKRIGKIYTGSDGLKNNYIYGIVPYHNILWLSTNAGISRFDPVHVQIKSFGIGDGLQSNEFNTYSFCKAANDEILFGGVNGLNAFYPADISKGTQQPQLQLTSLRLNDTVARLPVNITEIRNLPLSYQQNNISFEFTVLDYGNPSGNSLTYTLEGYDMNWVTVSNKTSIRYANLPPGNYTLKVKGYNAEGIETPSVYTLAITVATPWWKTWWFRSGIILIAGLMMWALIRMYYLRKIEQQRSLLEKQQAIEKERTRIATDMHDDFGAGLSRIKFLSERLQLTKPNSEEIGKQLEKISVYSDEMAEKMGEIVWALNEKYDSLGDLLAFCRSYASGYLADNNIRLHVEETGISEIKIPGETRRNIFLCIKECLHNVVKHARATEVKMHFILSGKEIKVVIHDNGKGIDEEHIRPFANGLQNIKKRMNSIQGYAHFENDHGTRVILAATLVI